MCLLCGDREVVGEFSNEDGSGFCSVECFEESESDSDYPLILEPVEGFDYSLPVPMDDIDESMDGDFDSGMASAGFGTDEDYGCYGGFDE